MMRGILHVLPSLGLLACASAPVGNGVDAPPSPSASHAAGPTASTPAPATSASATPVATASAASPVASAGAAAAVVKTLYVDSRKVACEGEGVTECLRVRESESAPWNLFYRTIEGFQFEPGSLYELKVEVSEVGRPPADASSLRHRLLEIVSKKKAP